MNILSDYYGARSPEGEVVLINEHDDRLVFCWGRGDGPNRMGERWGSRNTAASASVRTIL